MGRLTVVRNYAYLFFLVLQSAFYLLLAAAAIWAFVVILGLLYFICVYAVGTALGAILMLVAAYPWVFILIDIALFVWWRNRRG